MIKRGVVDYQIPSPMSTMPMASHPSTPTEMIVSSVMLDSQEVECCWDSICCAALFFNRWIEMTQKSSKVRAFGMMA